MNDIKKIAQALKAGEIDKALQIKKAIAELDSSDEYEIQEIVRQSIIAYLKKGEIYCAREAEKLFCLPKDLVDEAVKQAVMSSFCDGDMETVKELKAGLPISRSMAKELIEFGATWGKADCTSRLTVMFA